MIWVIVALEVSYVGLVAFMVVLWDRMLLQAQKIDLLRQRLEVVERLAHCHKGGSHD
jgi:hypothetical protein